MKIPVISIILPTYNGSHTISQSIKSVLAQSFSDWELLIVDDGSIDGVKEIVFGFAKQDARIKYFRNEKNLGIQKSLNRGLIESKGRFVGRIDDDDIWIDKDKLKKQIEFLNKNPDYVLVGTGVVVIDENDNEILRYNLPETDLKIREKMLSRNCFAHSSVVFLKDVVLKLGGYNESKETLHVEDYDLWLRMGKIGKFSNLPFYGLGFRLRRASLSSINKLNQLKKDIWLAKKYKNDYPNLAKGLFIGYLRIIMYWFLKIFPIDSVKNKLFKLAKEL